MSIRAITSLRSQFTKSHTRNYAGCKTIQGNGRFFCNNGRWYRYRSYSSGFCADDYKVGKKYNIGILTMVDRQGKFIDGLGEFSNRYVKNYKDDPNYEDVNVDISVN